MQNLPNSRKLKINDSNQSSNRRIYSQIFRIIFFILGMVFLGLGLVGVVLPVLPTTPFILLAATCFAKSSHRFHEWLLKHKVFGKLIKDWQTRRVIPRYAKYLAWTMMTVSCAMLFYRLPDTMIWVACLCSTICLITMLWMKRLPSV